MSERSRNSGANRPAGSRMEPKSELTDEQWRLIADLFPHESRTGQVGRPTVEPRRCVEGILWVLRSGARWKDLPTHFPSYPTCWRRFQQWTAAGIWAKAWARLLRTLQRQGRLDLSEVIADGTFSPAKKGGKWSARPNAARELRRWSLPTHAVCPSRQLLPAPVRTK